MRTDMSGEPDEKSPTLVLPIDQGEELFLAEGAEEAETLLALLRGLVTASARGIVVIFTMRSNSTNDCKPRRRSKESANRR